MSRSGRVTLFFGDAKYDFRIGIGEAEELDETFECGLLGMLNKVTLIEVKAIRETCRVGLVGGGMKREEAAGKADLYVRDGYFMECADIAARALNAALRGAPEDPPGESRGRRRKPAAATASPSPASTK